MKRPARRTPTTPDATGGTRSNLAGALALCAVLALFVVWTLPFMPHTVDDAWITFRYSLNWALGRGPYFNVAEHVEGYSNFLLMAVLALVIRIAGPDAALPASKAIGLCSAMVALAGSYSVAPWMARATNVPRPGPEIAGIAAAALTACAPGFQLNAGSGLEATLSGGLLVWGAWALASGTPRGVRAGALVLAAAALARPEGPFIFVSGWLLAGAVRRSRPPAVASERSGGAAQGVSVREGLAAGAIGLALGGTHIVFRRT